MLAANMQVTQRFFRGEHIPSRTVHREQNTNLLAGVNSNAFQNLMEK